MRSTDRKVTVERTIDAPAESIFAVLADPRRHHTIDGSDAVGEALVAAPPRLFRGARFTVRMRTRPAGADPAQLLQAGIALVNRGRLVNTVVEFEEPRRIAWRNFGRHVWRFELSPEGGGTRVRQTFDYGTNLFPPLLELFGFPAKNRTAMTATLARLDALVTTPA